jgi:hypothetical protein
MARDENWFILSVKLWAVEVSEVETRTVRLVFLG